MAFIRGFASEHRLSHRESEVISLAAGGLSTKEIGASLGCSPQTIAVYWGRIYRKLSRRCHREVMAMLLDRALRQAPLGHARRRGGSPV